MTRQREFKALVRERMAKTGERYAAARAQLLREHRHDDGADRRYPGVIAGYATFGGQQNGTAPLTNVLRQANLSWTASGQPFTEAVVNGLCGGPGFLYAVFEYKGWPPLLSIALQSRSMPDAYIAEGLGRLGVNVVRHETTSPTAARHALDAAIAAGRPALCAMGLTTVAVAGRDGDAFWIDGRAPVPTRLAAVDLARRRAAYKQARHRLVTIGGVDAKTDAVALLRRALADTATSYVEPAVPKSFQVNCGFAGLEKWRRLLTDGKDRKAWPTLFPDGPRACAGLARTYEWIACLVAPGAGRPLYADFLDVASRVLGEPSLDRAADGFREAGRLWSGLADFIAAVDDPVVRRTCDAAEQSIADLDAEGDCRTSSDPMEMMRTKQAAYADARLTKDQARAVYHEMAGHLGGIVEAERAAVAAMSPVVEPARGRAAAVARLT